MKTKLLLIAVLVCTILCGCKKGTPADAVEGFYKYAKTNEFEKSLTYTNVPDSLVKDVSELIGGMEMVIHEYEVQDTKMDEGDTTATVKVRLKVSNKYKPEPEETNPEIRCCKRDGEWKVLFL